MSAIGDVVIWAAIPIVLLICGAGIFVYWLTHHDEAPWESIHIRAERAYLGAKAAQQP